MTQQRCLQPGCTGTILDGYCDVCGLAPSPMSRTAPTASGAAASAMPGDADSYASARLLSTPIGSSRTAPGSRPTRRLGIGPATTRLGAGMTHVPPVPIVDPVRSLMNPAEVPEEKRFCSVCGTEVGRSRPDRPGKAKGFCTKCRTPYDFEPKLKPGMLVGGQYEVAGCLAHGGMGWIYLARDRNVNDRWVVLKGLLNAGDPDAYRAAVAEKQFLAEVEHPLIVEIYNFVTAADGTSYIVMEYVGGKALNGILKERLAANGGVFDPLPPDQAIAFMIEILPAFGYLHSVGLLYCDFKPANVIQSGDALKLIDLGGVRKVDDDVTPIYGTVGFQAPEVAAEGCTVASDLYTVARTLAVLIFEFRGYQNTYADSMPGPDTVPLFAQHDSLFRWLLKGTAIQPADRFQSADEMREQLLGVMREVTAALAVGRQGVVTRSTPSRLFSTPAIATDGLNWNDLPTLLADPHDSMTDWLAGVTADDPLARLNALAAAPEQTAAVSIATAYAHLETGDLAQADAVARRVLDADPWDWRGVWLMGLSALARRDWSGAVSAFNAVYGQVPGELAPKLALARACEETADAAVANRLYTTCAITDAAYVAPAQFGLARIAARSLDRVAALLALDSIPATSRAYGDAAAGHPARGRS
ncbi:MAG TPA: tetratricopeptide repeat protein [Ilumatobacteraceae bacterium]|nr:tetratricopeptide repeat protein [Ilumatobacteraceae bacterium]